MIVIRKATVADAAVLAETGSRSFYESHGHSAAPADIDLYISGKYTQHAMTEELQNPANSYHLLFFNDKLAGYSKMVLNATNEYIPATNVTCLDRLYLLKEFYGLQLGAALLEFNTNLSKQAGQAGMWLHTWTENSRAVTFYRKAGFVIRGNVNFKISEAHSNPNYVMYLEYNIANSQRG